MPHDEKLQLLDAAMDMFEPDRQAAIDEINVDDWVDAEMRRNLLGPNSRSKAMVQTGSTLDCFQHRTNGDGGCSLSARLRFEDREIWISTPSVHFRGVGFGDFDFDKAMKEELRLLLLEEAGKWITKKAEELSRSK